MRRRPLSLSGHVMAVAVGVFAVAVVVIWLGSGAPRPGGDAALTPTNQLVDGPDVPSVLAALVP